MNKRKEAQDARVLATSTSAVDELDSLLSETDLWLQASKVYQCLWDIVPRICHMLVLARKIEDEMLPSIIKEHGEMPEDLVQIDDIGGILYSKEQYQKVHLEYTRIVYPNILRSSLLINAMSAMEVWLVALCKQYKEIRGLQNNYYDRKGTTLEQAVEYLIKHAKINFPNSGQVWHKLQTINIVRNVAVHSDLVVVKESDCKKLKAPIASKLAFKLNPDSDGAVRILLGGRLILQAARALLDLRDELEVVCSAELAIMQNESTLD